MSCLIHLTPEMLMSVQGASVVFVNTKAKRCYHMLYNMLTRSSQVDCIIEYTRDTVCLFVPIHIFQSVFLIDEQGGGGLINLQIF